MIANVQKKDGKKNGKKKNRSSEEKTSEPNDINRRMEVDCLLTFRRRTQISYIANLLKY